MAVPIRFTHGYDAAMALLRFIVGFAWIGMAVVGLASLLSALGLDPSRLATVPHWASNLVYIAEFVAGGALGVYLHIITTNRWIAALSAWLYIRRTLRTDISFADATGIAWLFVPNQTGKWYPMEDVLQVPPEQRRQYLLAQAAAISQRVHSERSARRKERVQSSG